MNGRSNLDIFEPTDCFNNNLFDINVGMKELSEKDWKAKLTMEQFRMLRQGGTERAFTGKYVDNHEDGTYRCAGCDTPLFDSETKYDSRSGWPSFFQPISESNIEQRRDSSHSMIRIEAVCKNCGGHLGHVFDDGPNPTGMRFCINSGSLEFEKR